MAAILSGDAKPEPIPLKSGDRVRIPAFAAIGGRVLDEDGKPVAGASVQIPNTRWRTTTDQRGRFGLESISTKKVSLAIQGQGFYEHHVGQVTVNRAARQYRLTRRSPDPLSANNEPPPRNGPDWQGQAAATDAWVRLDYKITEIVQTNSAGKAFGFEWLMGPTSMQPSMKPIPPPRKRTPPDAVPTVAHKTAPTPWPYGSKKVANPLVGVITDPQLRTVLHAIENRDGGEVSTGVPRIIRSGKVERIVMRQRNDGMGIEADIKATVPKTSDAIAFEIEARWQTAGAGRLDKTFEGAIKAVIYPRQTIMLSRELSPGSNSNSKTNSVLFITADIVTAE